MDILDLLVDIKNKLESEPQAIEYEQIISIIDEAIEKTKIGKYCSISDACRIFLEISSDYKSEMYKELCLVDSTISEMYEKKIIEFYKENSQLSEKRIEKCVKNLKIYSDLFSEMVGYILDGKNFTNLSLIEVQGFTAKSLSENYPLTVVGAYNYLIYLREDPQSALNDLKNGLPRK